MTAAKAAHTNSRIRVKLANIPKELKAFDTWALVNENKEPITVVSQALPGRGHRYIASFNDPDTLATYDDARAYFLRAGDNIAALAVASPVGSRVVCVDLDYQEEKMQQRVNRGTVSQEDADNYCAAARIRINDIAKNFADKGAYIERSMSGNGWHIFFIADIPHKRYDIGSYGNVFANGQFIYVVGDIPKISDEPADQWPSDDSLRDGEESLPDLTEFFKTFENTYTNTGDLVPNNDNTSEESLASNVEYLLPNYTKYGRRTDLTDHEILDYIQNKLKKDWQVYQGDAGWSVDNTGRADWSFDTAALIGTFDKISGKYEQVRRLMEESPRMIHAGKTEKVLPGGRVVEGRDRWDRMFGKNGVFNKEVIKAREKNDRWFESGKTLPPMRDQSAIDHGRLLVANWEASKLPVANAHGSEEITQAPSSGTGNVLDEHQEGDPYDTAFQASIAKEEHLRVMQSLRNRPQSAELAKPRALEARDFLSCGIPPQYLSEEMLPPGKAGELCLSAYKAMYEPMVKFAVPATLSFLSGVVSRRYKVRNDGSGPVLNFIVCAQTATGKSQSVGVIEKLFGSIRCELHACKNRVFKGAAGSVQGMHGHLEEVPSCLWLIDECKASLQSIVKPKTPTDNNFQSFFNQLFDASTAKAVTNPYASRTSKKEGESPILNLSVATYWGTTISNITEFFTRDVVESGLPSRLLVVTHKGASAVEQHPSQMLRKLPEEQENLVKTLLRTAVETDQRYEQTAADANVDRSFFVQYVEFDQYANELFDKVLIQVGVFKRPVQNGISPFGLHYLSLARIAIMSARVAAILAICDNPEHPVINYGHYAWALGYCLNTVCSLMHAFDTNIIGTTRGDATAVAMQVIFDLSKKTKAIADGYVARHECIREMRKRLPFKTADDGQITSHSSHKMAEETVEILAKDGIIAIPVVRPSTKPLKAIQILDHPAWEQLSL